MSLKLILYYAIPLLIVLVAGIYLAHQYYYREKILIKSALKNCIYLIISILESLNPDYLQRTYLYEKRIRDSKTKVIFSFSKLSARHHLNLPKFDELYAVILDCGQIRWREKDPGIFALWQNELQTLIQHLKKLPWRHSDVGGYFDALRDSILKLEDTYHHVLKVAAKDPLVLIIFVESMKNLCNLLEEKFEKANHV